MREDTRLALIEVTAALAEADETEKKAKNKKESARKRFLALCTKAVSEERPIRKQVVEVLREDLARTPAESDQPSSEEQVEEWRLKNYPEWRVTKIEEEPMRYAYSVSLEEDPELMKFTFVNSDMKKVFGRTTETRGEHFDSEALRELVFAEDELQEVLGGAYKEKVVYEFDELHAQLVLSLHPELMPLFQRFTHPGKLNVKLTPIRNAKEEEVE